jgi:hypothetical protein
LSSKAAHSFFILGEESMKIAAMFGLVLGVPILTVIAIRQWRGSLFAGWLSYIQRAIHGYAVPWRGIAYAALLIVLIIFSTSILGTFSDSAEGTFGEWLTYSNVLFPSGNGADGQLQRLITSGPSEFETHYLQVLFLVLLLVLCFYLTRSWSLRRWAMAPFIVQVLLYTMLLPMLFGVLYLRAEFPTVTVYLSGGALLEGGPVVYLLNRRDGEIVLYDSGARRVVWLPEERIERIIVNSVAPILQRSKLAIDEGAE